MSAWPGCRSPAPARCPGSAPATWPRRGCPLPVAPVAAGSRARPWRGCCRTGRRSRRTSNAHAAGGPARGGCRPCRWWSWPRSRRDLPPPAGHAPRPSARARCHPGRCPRRAPVAGRARAARFRWRPPEGASRAPEPRQVQARGRPVAGSAGRCRRRGRWRCRGRGRSANVRVGSGSCRSSAGEGRILSSRGRRPREAARWRLH